MGQFLVLFFLCILGLVVVLVLGTTKLRDADLARRSESEEQSRTELKGRLGAKYVLSDRIKPLAIGLRPDERLIVISEGERLREMAYDALRAVTLTPTTETTIESTGETKTNRGSQLVGAGVGAAIAGPLGALGGALTGSQTQETSATSTTRTVDLELELFLRDEDMPRFVISARENGFFGPYVMPDAEEAFKNMAARLANIVDGHGAVT